MAKNSVLSLRVKDEMNNALNMLADIYMIDVQDVYRMAFGKLIAEKRGLIEEYIETIKKRYTFNELSPNCWHKDASTYTMWEKGNYETITLRSIEVFSDYSFREQKYNLVESLSEVAKKINDLGLDFKLNEQGLIYDAEDESCTEQPWNSEKLIIETLCDYCGETVIEMNCRNEQTLSYKLKDRYDINI